MSLVDSSLLSLHKYNLYFALRVRDWKKAEALVNSVAEIDPESLNYILLRKSFAARGMETPMSLVLQGGDKKEHMMNLRLAKILIERGVNPNNYMGMPLGVNEMSTPLSEIVDMYFLIAEDWELKKILMEKCPEFRTTNKSTKNIIGMNGEENLTYIEAKHQLLQMMDFLIEKGADPNKVTNTDDCTLMHRVLSVTVPDMWVLKKMCKTTADINFADIYGRTALMKLVDCGNPQMAVRRMDYIWKFARIRPIIELVDNSQWNLLMHSMWKGYTELAVYLCRKGAEQARLGHMTTSQSGYFMFNKISRLSSLFVPLLNDSRLLKEDDVSLCQNGFPKAQIDKIIKYSVAPVVDAGYLNSFWIQYELLALIMRNKKFTQETFPQNYPSVNDLIPLMFGTLSCGLQQLCVRTIMNQVFFQSSIGKAALDILKAVSTEKEYLNLVQAESTESLHSWVAYLLDFHAIKILMEHLPLPRIMETRFKIEAAKIQLCAQVQKHKRMEPFQMNFHNRFGNHWIFVTNNNSETESNNNVVNAD